MHFTMVIGLTRSAAGASGVRPAAAATAVAVTCHRHQPYSSRPAAGGSDDGQQPQQGGPGPGPRTRSIQQAQESGEAVQDPPGGIARSPDAPAEPSEAAANHGSDPQQVLKTSSWQAQQAMSGSLDGHSADELGGAAVLQQAAHMAGRLGSKVASAAGVAAQAASGAVSAMGVVARAATGAAAGGGGTAAQRHRGGGPDSSAVSDESLEDQAGVPTTNADTARAGELDTASGTATGGMVRRKAQQGSYQAVAERLMDVEGLPREAAGGSGGGDGEPPERRG